MKTQAQILQSLSYNTDKELQRGKSKCVLLSKLDAWI